MDRASIPRYLSELNKQNALRKRSIIESPQGVNIVVEGESLLSFCSNDYLGLANDSRVCTASVEAIKQYGLGSGASQLISGYSREHSILEEELADFLGYQRCVLFSSGYLANMGVLSAFSSGSTLLLQDKLNHASLIDAALNSTGNLKRYHHLDTNHAKSILSKNDISSPIIISDGVFSMEGSVAPLARISKLKNDFSGMAIIDDAHGIGVLGKQGKGSLEYSNISPTEIDILIGTFGKAFGSSGAFVAGDNQIIEYLIQAARTLIYTTAAPAALAAAARQSLKIIIDEPERRERLHRNIAYFKAQMGESMFKLLPSDSAIQSIIVGTNQNALEMSHKLFKLGILVTAIRPPTVPKNTSRLRITLCSEHTFEQIDKLTQALRKIELH